MIPLYGFLEGDSIGLLILGYEDDTVSSLKEKLKYAASVRVEPRPGGDVFFEGRRLNPSDSLKSIGIEALDRFDVAWSPR